MKKVLTFIVLCMSIILHSCNSDPGFGEVVFSYSEKSVSRSSRVAAIPAKLKITV